MTLAIGGSSTPAKPPHGTIWVDVRDYGAKADGGATDNSVPFQAAVDDLAAKLTAGGGNLRGVVFIPNAANYYLVYKSIWVDHDNIEIRGEGWGTTVQMYGALCHSVFIFGVRRVETAVVNGTAVPMRIDATNRPDLFGKLDASAAPAAGRLWGIRTNANSFVQFQASPISCGVSSAGGRFYSDLWSETSKLTVEFCCEPPDGKAFPAPSPLVGMGVATSEPSPFLLTVWDDPTKVLVMFRTSEMDQGSSGANRYFQFSLAGATAPYRIAVQFDLDNAVCSAFVNGAQVALTDTQNMAANSPVPFTPGAGLKFLMNDHFPLMIGNNGLAGSFGQPTTVDLRVYGLRFSNAVRYQNNGPGQSQKRADAPTTPVNDAYAYFGNNANTICFLTGADNPATSGRVVSVQNGNVAAAAGIGSGVFLHSTAMTPCAGNAIRDLFVQGGPAYGQAVSLGAVLDMTIRGVKAVGGFNGIGSFIMFANYTVSVEDCFLDGYDSAYFGALQLMYGRNIKINTAGRVAIRHLGCGARWENLMVDYATPVTEGIFKARGTCEGGTYSVSNMVVDFEGPTMSRAAFYCETHCFCPATTLTLKDIFLGTVGPSASLVMLKDTAREQDLLQKSYLSVENMQAYTNQYAAVVDVDGPLWHGEVRSLALKGPPFKHRQKWGANTNVVVRDTKYVAPPRSFGWYNGAHVLEVRSPADGQFTEWRCVGAGVYGTPSPPAWAGLRPLPASPNGLAAYVLNHAYMTAAIS